LSSAESIRAAEAGANRGPQRFSSCVIAAGRLAFLRVRIPCLVLSSAFRLPFLGLAFLLAACGTSPRPGSDRAAAAAATPPAASTAPRDAFVLLSGGGTPTSNNYSQYLQARAVTDFLLARYPREAVWIFFGEGNRSGEAPRLADVYRQIKDDGLLLDTWLPGALPENRVASKENFLRTLRTEILPRVRGGGTLYLFVGDHGELTGEKDPQSAITMWGLRRDAARPHGWATTRDTALTVTELRQALASGLGTGRVVFVMTQCHSGGFHELGVTREVQPPSSWFTTAPAWLPTRDSRVAPPSSGVTAAGFSATDQESIAAGCDPAPDPETWLGYERLLPEQLLGRDLLSGETRRLVRLQPSFAAAHDAAVLLDQTIDKPRSTSEHVLERWAALIEDHLTRELMLAPAVRDAIDVYHRAVDSGRFSARDPAWLTAHARHLARLERLATQNPAARRLLVSGLRRDLETPPAALSPPADPDESADDAGPSGLSRPQLRAWRETLRPAWIKAVAAGKVPALSAEARRFELRLHELETRRPAGFTDAWSDRALTELYWFSTYAAPDNYDAAAAGAVTRWAVTRRAALLAWADASPEPAVREAAARFGPEFRRPRTAPPSEPPAPIDLETAAARVLFQRRVLAAWQFLLALDHQPALAELRALQELERTPLPESQAR
jgi:hypothetical protein